MLPIAVSNSILEFLKNSSGKDVSLFQASPLGGGCINEALKLQSTEGFFFIKYNLAASYPGMFEREAEGLNLLSATNEIRIPEVIHSDIEGTYSYLLLEFIETGGKVQNFWEVFGKSLALLHNHSKPLYGLQNDNYIGSLPQSNRTHPDWNSFFVMERLEPQVKMCRDKGEIGSQLVRQFEIVYSKLPNLIPEEKPALLHGDLWNGNYIVDEGGNPCLIDPAVYFGHREVDLAMTRLFGEFSPLFYESYNAASPLEKGWEQRADIFNLYPLLVHVNLFGGGYISEVKQIINRFI